MDIVNYLPPTPPPLNGQEVSCFGCQKQHISYRVLQNQVPIDCKDESDDDWDN